MTTMQYQIFCDLDGVLVDFDKFANANIGSYEPKSQFWKTVDKWIKSGNLFFEAMEPMPDAMLLFEYIKEHNPTILSATGYVRNARTEKGNWVRQRLGDDMADRAIFVTKGVDKYLYATSPNHILIDDKEKVIGPWRDAGGIGILHTSAVDTIIQLQELGL